MYNIKIDIYELKILFYAVTKHSVTNSCGRPAGVASGGEQ